MAILVSLFLLATGVVGILNGLANLRTAASPGQRVVDFAALTYGVAGILAGLALWRWRRAAVYLAIVWGIAATVAAGVAPRAYGGPEVPLWSALLSGLLAALLGAAAVYYLARRLRPKSSIP